MNTFIHFGCWNNLNKDKGCLANVMELLNSTLESSPVDFISIAGDNYYPKKVSGEMDPIKKKQKKLKVIIESLLYDGFDLLPKNIKTYMILGNHDLETNIANSNEYFLNNVNTLEPVDNCSIIKYERDALKSKKLSNVDYVFYQSINMENNTLVLMLDSSIYSPDKKSGKFLSCYNEFLNTNYTNIKDVRDYQLQLILDDINNNLGIEKLILIGHHPIMFTKQKDGEANYDSDIPLFVDVLKRIKNELSDNVKYYYLCADVHLYQKGNITINLSESSSNMQIEQYIVGTGGTELDDNISADDLNKSHTYGDVTYTPVESKKECGFLLYNPEERDLFTFKGIIRGGGRKKKRVKNSRKKKRVKNSRKKKKVKMTKKRKYK
jgi:hypothetical protein